MAPLATTIEGNEHKQNDIPLVTDLALAMSTPTRNHGVAPDTREKVDCKDRNGPAKNVPLFLGHKAGWRADGWRGGGLRPSRVGELVCFQN